MRAVVYTESGDTSVLELVEREVPDPGPGEEEAGEAVRVGSRVVARRSVEHGDNGGVSVNNLNGGGWR